MADITITIPTAQVNRVLDAIAARNGYNVATDGTKAAFAKKCVIQWAMDHVRSYEGSPAGATAQQTAVTAVDSQILIT